MKLPAHLQNYAKLFQKDPRLASQRWFSDAKYGLFVHYGLYSLLGRGEWVMFEDRIPVQEYAELKNQFSAEAFSPADLVKLAAESGMKYLSLVVKHHDGFCLYDTSVTDFNSVNSPGGRDFVAEFAEACAAQGLGLFLYYSYGADWRHPFSLPRDRYESARPDYADMSWYRYKQPDDFKNFVNDMHAQLRELLTGYGAVAGVWFDLISACYFCPDDFPVAETYGLIRELQPHALISFKQGFTGDEDFMAQELSFVPISDRLRKAGASDQAVEHSEWAWRTLSQKCLRHEVCLALQKKRWGWIDGIKHRNATEVLAALGESHAQNCNLLLNVGPLPNGSLVPEDAETIRLVGEHILQNGFPSQKPAAISSDIKPAEEATLDA